jgi:hypothetical protein
MTTSAVSSGDVAVTDSASSRDETSSPSSSMTGPRTRLELAMSTYERTFCWAAVLPWTTSPVVASPEARTTT